jgi:hypothetical protein
MTVSQADFLSRAGSIRSKIFAENNSTFNEELAIELFQLQAKYVEPYQEYLNALKIDVNSIKKISEIPFLPIEFFKTTAVKPSFLADDIIFESSSTTGQGTSLHHVHDLSLYKDSFTKCFELFYGDNRDFSIFALLPNYLERTGSSLVYMMDHFIKESDHNESGFFLDDLFKLIAHIKTASAEKKKILLLGVSFALLDLAEKFSLDLSSCIVMETGGMKGRRKELLKQELHAILMEKFNSAAIHSEYGMTELLSQAYSKGNGIYHSPPWMRILIRDLQDPLFTYESSGRGAINIIDLANIYSCSFIATQDIGILHSDQSFEILGRLQDSDIRGCNLLVQ